MKFRALMIRQSEGSQLSQLVIIVEGFKQPAVKFSFGKEKIRIRINLTSGSFICRAINFYQISMGDISKIKVREKAKDLDFAWLKKRQSGDLFSR